VSRVHSRSASTNARDSRTHTRRLRFGGSFLEDEDAVDRFYTAPEVPPEDDEDAVDRFYTAPEVPSEDDEDEQLVVPSGLDANIQQTNATEHTSVLSVDEKARREAQIISLRDLRDDLRAVTQAALDAKSRRDDAEALKKIEERVRWVEETARDHARSRHDREAEVRDDIRAVEEAARQDAAKRWQQYRLDEHIDGIWKKAQRVSEIAIRLDRKFYNTMDVIKYVVAKGSAIKSIEQFLSELARKFQRSPDNDRLFRMAERDVAKLYDTSLHKASACVVNATYMKYHLMFRVAEKLTSTHKISRTVRRALFNMLVYCKFSPDWPKKAVFFRTLMKALRESTRDARFTVLDFFKRQGGEYRSVHDYELAMTVGYELCDVDLMTHVMQDIEQSPLYQDGIARLDALGYPFQVTCTERLIFNAIQSAADAGHYDMAVDMACSIGNLDLENIHRRVFLRALSRRCPIRALAMMYEWGRLPSTSNERHARERLIEHMNSALGTTMDINLALYIAVALDGDEDACPNVDSVLWRSR